MTTTLPPSKEPLHRHRGGSFGISLRDQPPTLSTLRALVPPGVGADIPLIDEGIGAIPDRLGADLGDMTQAAGTAPRAVGLSPRLRGRA